MYPTGSVLSQFPIDLQVVSFTPIRMFRKRLELKDSGQDPSSFDSPPKLFILGHSGQSRFKIASVEPTIQTENESSFFTNPIQDRLLDRETSFMEFPDGLEFSQRTGNPIRPGYPQQEQISLIVLDQHLLINRPTSGYFTNQMKSFRHMLYRQGYFLHPKTSRGPPNQVPVSAQVLGPYSLTAR